MLATDAHGWPQMNDKKIHLLESELTEKVIGVCIDVSRELGGGFLESVYLEALIIALTQAGLKVVEQLPLKVMFRGQVVGDFYPVLLVEGRLIIELKAVKSLTSESVAIRVHPWQRESVLG